MTEVNEQNIGLKILLPILPPGRCFKALLAAKNNLKFLWKSG
jgi:hypothetical protein